MIWCSWKLSAVDITHFSEQNLWSRRIFRSSQKRICVIYSVHFIHCHLQAYSFLTMRNVFEKKAKTPMHICLKSAVFYVFWSLLVYKNNAISKCATALLTVSIKICLLLENSPLVSSFIVDRSTAKHAFY